MDNKQDEFQDILQIISRSLGDKATIQEEEHLMEWLKESEENRRFFADISADFSLLKTVSSKDYKDDEDLMLSRINSRIDADETLRKARKTKIIRISRMVASVAAAAVLVFGCFAVWTHFGKPDAVEMERIFNSSAEICQFVLEDGTSVWLKPGSGIRYNTQSISDKRVAVLSGEAYFDVTSNLSRPFVVTTSNINIQVLGTAFSVKTNDNLSDVVLERGIVKIISAEGSGMVTLKPNQRAVYEAATGDLHVESVYSTSYVTREYNLVSMQDVTLTQIISSLEKQFNVKIVCAETDDGTLYNFNYLKSYSFEEVLAIVRYLTGARLETE